MVISKKMPREGAFYHLIIISYPRQDKRSKRNGSAFQHDFMLLTVRFEKFRFKIKEVINENRAISLPSCKDLWVNKPVKGATSADEGERILEKAWLVSPR
ncbi:hypothetical protein TNCV_1177591 [Trichonephila clavipes]|nr:hypothetical protein TNCV_1177591 [Trichonephila clavipes]